jgi:hypothetical protein
MLRHRAVSIFSAKSSTLGSIGSRNSRITPPQGKAAIVEVSSHTIFKAAESPVLRT